MTTFTTQKFTCKHCNHRMFTYELGSYHVYSSESYSDGYVDYDPPISFNTHILICSNCMSPLWRSDLVYEEVDYDSEDDTLDQSKDIYDLKLNKGMNLSYNIASYYSDIIVDGFADNVDKEVLLRIEMWHLLNNNYRYGSPSILDFIFRGKFKFAYLLFKQRNKNNKEDKLNLDLFIKNINRLIEIFKPENDEEKLLLAEMYREIGNFSGSKAILKEIKELDNTKAYKIIRKAIKRRSKRVTKLN